MLIRIISGALIALGCVIMVITNLRYYRYLRQNRAERYDGIEVSRTTEMFSQLVLLFFVASYIVGFIDVLRRPVEPIYLFVCVVFCVGGLFIAALVQMQIALADSLRQKNLEVMRGFVNSIEMKDPYTRGHSAHVYHITLLLYRQLPVESRRKISQPKLLDAALLHDIGKMGVPDEILNKKTPLSDAEWEAIRTHTSHGAQMLADTCYREISDWVLYHHERMDGHGYHGIPGNEIPVEARIITVADTYSAMTTDREYRPKRSHAEAVKIMREVAGSQLDAELVETFCGIDPAELNDAIEQIRQELGSVMTAG